MSNFDSGEAGDEHWDERGELAWNDFDWERYLRGQEGAITSYLQLYEEAGERPDRIDHVAERMDWGAEDWTSEEGGEGGEDAARYARERLNATRVYADIVEAIQERLFGG